MKIVITGATGFIGSHIVATLRKNGHEVRLLKRNSADKELLEGSDALIHLSGESIVSGLWTAAKKRRLYESRIDTTKHLCAALQEVKNPPRVVLIASAVGYYGSRGDELLTEESQPGSGFLSDLCRDWEAAAHGACVIHLRFGVVLDPSGGMLKKLLPIFKWGLGGKIGSGKQWMSWIQMRDLVRVFEFLLESRLSGAFNIVAPHPVTNSEFTKELGTALHRPTFCRVPAWIIKLLLGRMGEETLLASQRVLPKRLLEAGFQFEVPELGPWLRTL